MSSSAGTIVWTPSCPEQSRLGPPRLQFRSTDDVIFKVHDNLLFPQSLALQILLGDMPLDDDPYAKILPLNISSDGLKLILHFIYNFPTPDGGWIPTEGKDTGASLQTIHSALMGCQQYMMHTVATALEAPLRANMKADPLFAAVIAHVPIIANPALCEDTIRLAANTPATFLGSQAPRRALLPPNAVDLLYQYRDELHIAVQRQESAQSAKIIASFKVVDDGRWNEYGGAEPADNRTPHFQACRHWHVVGNLLQIKLNELLLDLLREKVGIKKSLDVEFDIGCSIRTNCRGCRELLSHNMRKLAKELKHCRIAQE